MAKLTDTKRINQAFVNSYNIIMSGETIDEYIENMEINLINLDVIFAHDPTTPLTKYELLFLLTYFEDMEDYNKCHNLYKILKNEIEGLSSRDQQKSD
jgi:hypothetical protein